MPAVTVLDQVEPSGVATPSPLDTCAVTSASYAGMLMLFSSVPQSMSHEVLPGLGMFGVYSYESSLVTSASKRAKKTYRC